MLIIGVTGGVGSGKSTILDEIKKLYNCRIIKTDEIANDIKKPGELCYNKLVFLLGESILLPDKEIDKNKMAELIFKNKHLLDEVNEILHPEVEKYIDRVIFEEKKNKNIDILFIEAALLIEVGYKDKFLDELWYVYSDEPSRKNRLKESRNYSDDKINEILSSQQTDEGFRYHSDFVIDNSKTVDYAVSQIKDRLKKISFMEKNI